MSWEKVKSAFLYYKDPQDGDHQNIRSDPGRCNAEWMSVSFPVIERYRQAYESGRNPFLDLPALFGSPTIGKQCCRNGELRWRQSVEGAILDLPKFSQYLLHRSEKGEGPRVRN
jgi:hypothetical protein